MSIVALTGAGISKASGVPTFVEMGNFRDKLSRAYFNAHPKDFYHSINEMRRLVDQSEPNPAHRALAKHQIKIITMNIDGLHHKAGSKEDDVIEIHGSLRRVFCSSCGSFYPFSITEDTLYCPDCPKQLLQPDIVLYGDTIPKLASALSLAQKCSELMIVGTSFYTSTAHYIKNHAENHGTTVTIINEYAERFLPAELEKRI